MGYHPATLEEAVVLMEAYASVEAGAYISKAWKGQQMSLRKAKWVKCFTCSQMEHFQLESPHMKHTWVKEQKRTTGNTLGHRLLHLLGSAASLEWKGGRHRMWENASMAGIMVPFAQGLED